VGQEPRYKECLMQRRHWNTHGSPVLTALLLQLLVACAAPAILQSPTPPLAAATVSATVQFPTSPGPPTATQPPAPIIVSSTPVPAPTLSESERQMYLLQLAANNGGCALPCFWGLEPGKTPWLVADGLLTQLEGTPPLQGQYSDGRIYHASGFNVLERDSSLGVVIVDDNGIIQSIEFDVQNVHILEQVSPGTPSPFADDWIYYSLDRILTMHGIPAQVVLRLRSTLGEPDSDLIYGLWVYYDQLGFAVRYTGPAIYGEPLRVCPVFNEIRRIQIYSQAASGGPSLYDLATTDVILDYLKPLEEAAGMSAQEFYETFRHSDSQACLESPRDIWPP
jgi:hypothetical protein